MTQDEVLLYVRAAAVAVALPLDDAQAGRVATHLARTAALARMLDEAGMSASDEPAEIYAPAPFPEAAP
jgi:hypothetical protein